VARRPRSSRIETRTPRLKLPVRRKPYDFTPLAPGIRLGYRRNKGAGVWVVSVADGHGGAWIKNVAHADDYEPSNGEQILDFWQAQDRARALARGKDAGAGQPATVAAALNDYAADLKARSGHASNVGRVRLHLTPTLASKPIALLTAVELKRWRDCLIASGLRPSTTLRTCKALAAALNLAARHDPRIANREAWRVGLGGLTDTHNPRNVILTDREVLALVAAAYKLDAAFGLYVEVHAACGARSSQIARLTVADLQADRPDPRLMMPASRKGKARHRGLRKPVPITIGLATRLQHAGTSRAPSGPLLVRSDGAPWRPERGDHAALFRRTAEAAGLDGKTIYSLRHSSIVRSLINGTPTRVVAAIHDTSVGQIERTYSAFIADHADEVARRGLLDTTQPLTETNVVALPGRRS
jgi:integrase